MKSLSIISLLIISMLASTSATAQLNKKLISQLKAIYKTDQMYRVAAIAAAKKYGAYSQQDNDLMTKQRAADIANLAKVEKIITAYGYPGKSMVGEQSKVVFMVVQHNDADAQEKYLPLFIKAAKTGELDRKVLPLMIDRLRSDKGQLQLYGTQMHETKDGRVLIKPIEDEPNVNVRRKEAGLPPLEDYYKHWGIKYKVPTTAGNTNPKELYYHEEKRAEVPIEAIGGDENIIAQLAYPEQAKANHVTGFVTVEYTVDKDGSTKDITVIKGLGYGCDEEAIRVIKKTKYTNLTGEDSSMRMRLPFPNAKK